MTQTAWDALYAQVENCTACPLCTGRKNAVPGEGDPHAAIMFVGEGPGADEDATGRPFVGKAGQLLEKMLDSIDLTRQQVYIANVIKCRPPQNRNPAPEELRACLPYLHRQIEMIQPRIIVCLGKFAAGCLIHENFAITRERGQWHTVNGRQVIATFHPAALLRDERLLIDAWRDMQAVKAMAAQLTEDAHG